MSKQVNKLFLYICMGIICSGTVLAQKAERKNVREGNKLFNSEQYTEAEIAYRKGLDVNPRSFEGTFNLGNALYKQEKYPEAMEQYQLLAGQGERLIMDDPENKFKLSEVFHNMGNIGMKNKDYSQSINAYKQALRLNPQDEETRYNLALAQKLLEEQESEDNEDNQNENEEDQNEDQQQQEQPDQQQNDQQDNQSQQEEQQNEQMSQDNAQQILDAFLQDEKDTQEKVQKAQQKQQERRRTDKEW